MRHLCFIFTPHAASSLGFLASAITFAAQPGLAQESSFDVLYLLALYFRTRTQTIKVTNQQISLKSHVRELRDDLITGLHPYELRLFMYINGKRPVTTPLPVHIEQAYLRFRGGLRTEFTRPSSS